MPADEIWFTIEYGGRTEHLTDKGIFSPNVRIAHEFNGFYNTKYHAPTPSGCSVDYVHFSNGSSWSRPRP
jgi:hypothetical protein